MKDSISPNFLRDNTTNPDVFFQDLDDGDLGGELVRETQDERDEMMGPKAFGHVKLVQVIPDKTQQVFLKDRPAWTQKTGRFSDHLWYTVDDSVYMRLQPPLLEGFERKFLSARNFSINLPIISAVKSFSKMQVWQLPSILGKIVGYNIYVAAPRLISSKHCG